MMSRLVKVVFCSKLQDCLHAEVKFSNRALLCVFGLCSSLLKTIRPAHFDIELQASLINRSNFQVQSGLGNECLAISGHLSSLVYITH